MRAAIFGATIDDVPNCSNYVRASSRLTHTDPKAELELSQWHSPLASRHKIVFPPGKSLAFDGFDRYRFWFSNRGFVKAIFAILRKTQKQLVWGDGVQINGD